MSVVYWAAQMVALKEVNVVVLMETVMADRSGLKMASILVAAKGSLLGI